VSCAGLAPVLALAERCGLRGLLEARLRLSAASGANATVKVLALVAGMVAGADSITDMDLLRHGGMRQLFEQVRAPSTLGMLLRCFTFGHVRALDGIAARLLARLTGATPILGGADQLVLLDLDDTVRATYGPHQTGRRARLQRRQRAQRPAGHADHPGLGAGHSLGRGYAGGRRTPRAGRSSYSPTPWPPPAAAVDGGWWWCAPMRRSTTVRSSRPAGGPGHGSP
jgi:hypothetical protein